MRCPVLSYGILTHRVVLTERIVLPRGTATSGTERAYGATRMSYEHYASRSKKVPAYGIPMRCPVVLTYHMLLSAYVLTMPCPVLTFYTAKQPQMRKRAKTVQLATAWYKSPYRPRAYYAISGTDLCYAASRLA
eukprot:3913119-Rhodomonas_salina.3